MAENLLTDAMVRNAILGWNQCMTEQVPVEQMEMRLAEDVEMRYPNTPQPFVGRPAFRAWYANVLNLYFDQTHEVESWDIQLDGNRAVAKVIIRWEHRSRKSDEPRSHYAALLTHQRIELERSPRDGSVTIRKKIVESGEPTTPIYGPSA